MEIVSTLLRIAARAAGASAALVARLDADEPVAAWGCNAAAARALLRVRRRDGADGPTLFAVFPLRIGDDGATGELLIAAPATEYDRAAIAAMAVEIGAACGSAGAAEELSALERLGESVEQLGEAIAIFETPREPGAPTNFVHVNAGFTALFGCAPDEIVGRPGETIWGPLTDKERMEWLRSRLTEREPARAVIVLYTKDGTPLWTEVISAPVRHPSNAVHHVVTFRDVTSRKQFEDAFTAEKRKLQTTLAAIADAVVTVLPDGRVEFVNAAAQRLIGIEMVDAYGADVRDVLQLVDDAGEPIDLGVGARSGETIRRGDGHLRAASGILDVAYVASRIAADEGGTVVVLRDVTAEHRVNMRLSFEASHDPLTGLQNRRMFSERLDDAVLGAREREEHHVVGFLDLDRFKVVNDRFGHATGDRLLREIGRVMGRVVRGGDVVARIGGDEFGLLLANCRLVDARRIAEKLRAAVDAYRIEHDGEVLDVGVSIGLAPIEADTTSAATALADADAACYQAKAAGRNAIAG